MKVQTQVDSVGGGVPQGMSQYTMASNELQSLLNKKAEYLKSEQMRAMEMFKNNPSGMEQYMQTLSQNNPYDQMISVQQQRVKELGMREQGFNPDGSPIAKEFQTILDKDGNLPDKYKLNPELLDPNTLEGYSMIKKLATEEGPSKFAQTANLQATLGRQDAIDAASRQSAASAQQARGQLMSRGGASAGARERLMSGANDNLMSAKQGAYRNTGNQLLDIMKQDETMKRQALSQFGEAEGKIASGNLALKNDAQKGNLGTMLREEDMRRSYNTDTYKAALDKWAANRQAEATRNSGGGGGK